MLRVVALKVLASPLAASGTARQRFAREARAAARLGDPANAVLWVQAAADAAGEAPENERAALAHLLDNAPELVALRTDSGFQRARAGLS